MASFSSSSSPGHRKYDVFLSFRGEDTRATFVSHLYQKLLDKRLFTFIDNRGLEDGDPIFGELQRAIQNSSFAIVVISKNFATSRWCLEELRVIMELKRDNKLEVIPIFYGVATRDLRKQSGSFAKPFERCEISENPEKVREWRDALIEVVGFNGKDSANYKNDAELIEDVAGNILRRSLQMSPIDLTHLVGMDAHMERMQSLLSINESEDDEVRMIGIWGMGGIGKTAIAKYLYSKFSNGFPIHWFMENTNEVFSKYGLLYLQEQFLSTILHKDNIKVWSVEHGSNEIKKGLSSQRAFVVLDNVNDVKQLHALAKDTSWFGPGSRVIITTRNKRLLNKSCGEQNIYKVKCVEDDVGLQIFRQYAFKGGSYPSDDYEKLSIRACRLAGGLPSLLERLGSSLCDRACSLDDWEAVIRLHERAPHENIMKILEYSYYDLQEAERRVFLLIVCFFNGAGVNHVVTLLDDERTVAKLAIDDLALKSLISITDNECINVHDLIEQSGKQIIRRESTNPRDQLILWHPDDIQRVLEENTRSVQSEGIALNMCETTDEWSLDGSCFKQMKKLKFLKFHKHIDYKNSISWLTSNIGLHGHKLRLLHWDEYPLRTLPSNFRLDCLVELNLRYSNLEKLWEGNPVLSNLMRLDLTGSKDLKELPDLSKAKKLRELRIMGCKELKLTQEIICSLYSLEIFESWYSGGLKSLLTVKGEATAHQKGGSSHICCRRQSVLN